MHPGAKDGVPRAVPEVDVFTFRALRQGGGTRQLPWGSAEVSLVFDARGIEIRGEQPGEYSVIPWASVTRVSRGASEASPGGGSVTVIGIETPGRIMRFAVASDHRDPVELSALSYWVARWSVPGGSVGPGEEAVDLPIEPPPAGFPAAPPTEPPPTGGPPAGPPPDGSSLGAGRIPGGSTPGSSSLVPWSTPTGLPTPAALPGGYLPSRPLGPDGPLGPVPESSARRGRTRRVGLLALALAFLGSGIGLALALSGASNPQPAALPHTSPATPDQELADQLMLTQNDLPAGWSVSSGSAGSSDSPRIHAGESRITRTFARCMEISESQAAVVLGGGAADQTAQTSSPLFLGPPMPGRPGFALELQTAATIVRSHQDEQDDFALLDDPRYPNCAGAAFASETQLGADTSSGRAGPPVTPSVSVVDIPAHHGEQVSALLVAFTVADRSVSVPVEVETVSLGYDRIEANLQALAIGGQIPPGAVTPPLSVFVDRVAGGGQSAEA